MATWWAVVGVIVMFATAAVRLGTRGVVEIRAGLSALEWAALVVLTAAFVYGEGERGIARAWLPRVLARARALGPASPVLHRLLAPLHVMGLVGQPVGTLVRSWAGVAAIVVAVVVVQQLPRPWRGIVDFAVAAALAWASIAVVRQASSRSGS